MGKVMEPSSKLRRDAMATEMEATWTFTAPMALSAYATATHREVAFRRKRTMRIDLFGNPI